MDKARSKIFIRFLGASTIYSASMNVFPKLEKINKIFFAVKETLQICLKCTKRRVQD